jgi:adenylate cyclase
MTAAVWTGYRKAAPTANSVQNGWFKPLRVPVPGYSGEVFGGDVIFNALKEDF